jgi:hypothetical protein
MTGRIGCHTFRATGITAYLEAGGTLENAQAMAAHERPRTTKLYDRTGDEITLDEVQRISIGLCKYSVGLKKDAAAFRASRHHWAGITRSRALRLKVVFGNRRWFKVQPFVDDLE